MNILLATDASLERGGITLFMLQWIRGIKEAYPGSGVHVYFRYQIEEDELADRYRELGVSIHTGGIPTKIKFRNPGARLKVQKDIRSILGGAKFDVVHIHSGIFGYNADILKEAKRAGVSVRISHSHGAYPEKGSDKVVHFFLIRRIRRLATAYAGCSRKAGQYLFGKKGTESARWHFIPNTIQTDRFAFHEGARDRVRSEAGLRENELLLGAVGHLSYVKNHSFLIDLMAEIKKKGTSARLIILGQGIEREKLEKQIADLGVDDRVILYGPADDVPGWLSAMDYYLMPSRSEGFPISAVEAQASGLVCLLSDRISEEVDLTQNVYHLSIDQGVQEWVRLLEHIKPASADSRKEAALVVKRAGFDASDTRHYVRSLYKL